jgi:cob(I)alamin adenosyltransferase
MKIYTRAGDDGSTGVLGAGRVSKSAPRVEAYGEVDELNAILGRVRSLDTEHWIEDGIAPIQNELFLVGAELATVDPRMLDNIERVSDEDVARLETTIDRLEQDLEPLQNFIVPGGAALAAELHVARTVCRRAERRVVALQGVETVEPRLVRYLNRLADLLFVYARWCNQRAGVGDVAWRGGKGDRKGH